MQLLPRTKLQSPLLKQSPCLVEPVFRFTASDAPLFPGCFKSAVSTLTDHSAFELGEAAEYLHRHPSARSRGVNRLCQTAKSYAGSFDLLIIKRKRPDEILNLLTSLPVRLILQTMTMRKLTHIVIVFALIMGQAFASTNAETKTGLQVDNAQLNITSILTSDVDRAQDNCSCSESDCSDGLTQNCAYAAGSARCASGVFGTLIGNLSLLTPELNGSTPINYQTPIYYNISLGITPRPPKPVV